MIQPLETRPPRLPARLRGTTALPCPAPAGSDLARQRALDDIRYYAAQAEFQLSCITAFLETDGLRRQVSDDFQGHLAAAAGMCRTLDRVLGDIRDTSGGDRPGAAARRGAVGAAHRGLSATVTADLLNGLPV